MKIKYLVNKNINSELLTLNESQKQFSNYYVIKINMENTMNLHFNFIPNFPFADKYKDVLDKITIGVSQKLIGKTANFVTVCIEVMKELMDYFNPLYIGIRIDSDMETMLKKQYELKHQQSLYAETFKNHQVSEKPSFEEWMSWEE